MQQHFGIMSLIDEDLYTSTNTKSYVHTLHQLSKSCMFLPHRGMFLPHRGIPVTPTVEYHIFFSSSKPVPASILRPSTYSIHSNRWGEWLVTSVSITSGSYSRIRIFFSTQIVIVALDSNCNRRRWIQSRIVSYQWLAYPSYFSFWILSEYFPK